MRTKKSSGENPINTGITDKDTYYLSMQDGK